MVVPRLLTIGKSQILKPDLDPHKNSIDDSSHPAPQPRRQKSRWRYLIYPLVIVAVIVGGFELYPFAWAIYATYRSPDPRPIDVTSDINDVMLNNYGPYSNDRKGWVYTDSDGHTWLMQVVQRASADDSLYFVAAGTPMGNGQSKPIYGVFKVSPGHDATGGRDVIGSPVRASGDVPLAPERVHFEALSETVWAWVVKEQYGSDPDKGSGHIDNVVLAPHDDHIAVLATFAAAVRNDPGVDCDEANRRYDAYVKSENATAPASTMPASATDASSDAPASSGDATAETTEEADEEGVEDDTPQRCSNAHWNYQVSSDGSDIPAPIVVSGHGLLNGQELGSRKQKLLFDTQSYTYIVPEDLQGS
jgi:hypothetical protein